MTIPGPDGIELDVWNDGIFMVDPLRYDSGVMLNMFVARLKFKEFERMIIKETNSDPDPSTVSDETSKKRATPHKRYCNVFTEEEMVSSVEKEIEEEAMLRKGKDKTNVSDEGKEKMVVESDSENDGMCNTPKLGRSVTNFVLRRVHIILDSGAGVDLYVLNFFP
ncbi:hypothetical protein Tco_1522849 [Tanacetum coccineum]